jgi:hypothetical protein
MVENVAVIIVPDAALEHEIVNTRVSPKAHCPPTDEKFTIPDWATVPEVRGPVSVTRLPLVSVAEMEHCELLSSIASRPSLSSRRYTSGFTNGKCELKGLGRKTVGIVVFKSSTVDTMCKGLGVDSRVASPNEQLSCNCNGVGSLMNCCSVPSNWTVPFVDAARKPAPFSCVLESTTGTCESDTNNNEHITTGIGVDVLADTGEHVPATGSRMSTVAFTPVGTPLGNTMGALLSGSVENVCAMAS